MICEAAKFFAPSPSHRAILEFRPSLATVERANQLLELNRTGTLDEAERRELDQLEMAESLMRLVKARIRAGQAQEQSKQASYSCCRGPPPNGTHFVRTEPRALAPNAIYFIRYWFLECPP